MCPEDEQTSSACGPSSPRLGVTLTCGDPDNSHASTKKIWTSSGLNKTPEVEIHCPCSPHSPCNLSIPGNNNKGFGSFVKRLTDAEAAIVSAAAQLVSFKDILKDARSSTANKQRVAKQRGLLLQKMEDFRQINKDVRQKLNQLLEEEMDQINAGTKIDALLNKILQAEHEIELLKGDLSVAEKRAEELMSLQQQEQENIKSALNMAKSAEANRARTQGQLRSKEADNNRLTVQVKTLERAQTQHKAEIEELKVSLASLTEQSSQEKEALKKASRAHKQRAERFEVGLDKCFFHLKEKDVQLKVFQQEKETWMREKEQLSEENHKLAAHVEFLQRQASDLELKLQVDVERQTTTAVSHGKTMEVLKLREKEIDREMEGEMLKGREMEIQREKEREKEWDREKERKELEIQKKEWDREKERKVVERLREWDREKERKELEIQKENEWAKKKERKELEIQKEKEIREVERLEESDREKERQELEIQKEKEWAREKERKELDIQKEKEIREVERLEESDREKERQEIQKKEWEREKERKELERLKESDREKERKELEIQKKEWEREKERREVETLKQSDLEKERNELATQKKEWEREKERMEVERLKESDWEKERKELEFQKKEWEREKERREVERLKESDLEKERKELETQKKEWEREKERMEMERLKESDWEKEREQLEIQKKEWEREKERMEVERLKESDRGKEREELEIQKKEWEREKERREVERLKEWDREKERKELGIQKEKEWDWEKEKKAMEKEWYRENESKKEVEKKDEAPAVEVEMEQLTEENQHYSNATLKVLAQFEDKLAECEAALVQEKIASREKDGKVEEYQIQVAELEADLCNTKLQCKNLAQDIEILQAAEEAKVDKVRQELQGRVEELRAAEGKLLNCQEKLECSEWKCSAQSETIRQLQFEVETQGNFMRSTVELKESAEKASARLQEQVDVLQRRVDELRETKLELDEKLKAKEAALCHSNQQLEQRTSECKALNQQLDQRSVECEAFSQQITKFKEQALSKEEDLQNTIHEHEAEKKRIDHELKLLRQSKCSAEKQFEVRLKQLQLSLDQCESHKKSMQNYVNFLKNSYLLIFEDQISTFWSSGFLK
uniref:trichohyalin-like isoform X1 n=1 Tax=Doryrhamphus excisus TaxID=161450 RepID=UPI0025AE017E|nr:trichohyalin-like isoform X1 [Doryrhamphus excisus]